MTQLVEQMSDLEDKSFNQHASKDNEEKFISFIWKKIHYKMSTTSKEKNQKYKFS